MELKDLVGEHVLTGVQFGKGPRHEYDDQDPESMSFVLDGVVYTAIEDPSDGYRSAMREIKVGGEVAHTFPPVKVLARHRTRGDYGDEDDVLELLDAANGKVILEVGTTAVDDYYPSFMTRWTPEDMAINAASGETQEEGPR